MQFRDIKAGGITRDDHEREMFEINDINSNKERSPGGYYPLGIQGCEAKTKYEPNKTKAVQFENFGKDIHVEYNAGGTVDVHYSK